MLVALLTLAFQLMLVGTALSVGAAMAYEAYAARDPRVGTVRSRRPAIATGRATNARRIPTRAAATRRVA